MLTLALKGPAALFEPFNVRVKHNVTFLTKRLESCPCLIQGEIARVDL